MKTTLKIEELSMFLLSVYAFSLSEFAWWWFLVLFLLPDISMFGYGLGSKAGAIIYNLFHHKALAIFLFLIGIYFENDIAQLLGIIFFAHAAFDRFLGYGLKYQTGFKFTHLGKIGKD